MPLVPNVPFSGKFEGPAAAGRWRRWSPCKAASWSASRISAIPRNSPTHSRAS